MKLFKQRLCQQGCWNFNPRKINISAFKNINAHLQVWLGLKLYISWHQHKNVANIELKQISDSCFGYDNHEAKNAWKQFTDLERLYISRDLRPLALPAGNHVIQYNVYPYKGFNSLTVLQRSRPIKTYCETYYWTPLKNTGRCAILLLTAHNRNVWILNVGPDQLLTSVGDYGTSTLN